MIILYFRPEFVEFIPSHLEDDVIYISIAYKIAVHKCACGCGNKVVTPIGPTDWRLEYDGDSVSLSPSIGNWQFPCRSHYWIKSNVVRWSRRWTDDEILAGRERDIRAKERYFAPDVKNRPLALATGGEDSSYEKRLGPFRRFPRKKRSR